MRNMEDFYKILKEPKHIVAPMVDQSELPWRILSRKYGAQLCFTPMYSANTLVNNKSYKNKVLLDLSCDFDRPIIVQFCANSASTLLEAGKIVQDHCDAIDLNLGCPQHIAKRGFFGAFLQDEWKLLEEMISTCKNNLHIPITAKIRVFEEIPKTIKYAQMLESAGCSMITVHGRTREQRRENTGLASWQHVTEIKAAVSIPVISNGNILNLHDVERCLEATGCDGVMVAETHLHNPAIFTGENPPVYDVVKEYLMLAEKHTCAMSAMRSHLFRLWHNTLLIFLHKREVLGNANTINDLYDINESLHNLCKTNPGVTSHLEHSHWICQYHIRVRKPTTENNKNTEESRNGLSRNELRRQRRYQRKIAAMKTKRTNDKDHKKERSAVKRQHEDNVLLGTEPANTVRRKDRLLQRLDEARQEGSGALRICVDLSWSDKMNDKELCKLSNQLGRLYGSLKCAVKPAHVLFTGFSKSSLLYKECERKHQGFENFRIDYREQGHMTLFPANQIVYLTPDAEEDLVDLRTDEVYIVGGLVDETVSKQLTLDRAQSNNVKRRRLPIETFFQRSGCHSNYSTVLAVNQVIDILLEYSNSHDWTMAIKAGLPPRKGYIART